VTIAPSAHLVGATMRDALAAGAARRQPVSGAALGLR
jgi:hypothetical protein